MFNKLIDVLANAGAPVAQQVGTITPALLKGGVTVLVAETGSGKSLATPPAWADAIAAEGPTSLAREALQRFGVADLIVVCVPRRFLAISSAETVAELAGVELGREVGYATGEGDAYTPGVTRVLFATYGSALKSGLIGLVTRIVFDEVHEGAMDISIARALVHRRLRLGEQVSVLEMSATLNAPRQQSYWGEVAPVSVFDIKGGAQPCDLFEEKIDSAMLEEVGMIPAGFRDDITPYACAYRAVKYIAKQGRKGVLVFRPGIADCAQTAALVSRACQLFDIPDVGAAAITGNLDATERRRVVRDLAAGKIRVLVGTNVIESGVNLKGVDAAIGCGKGKVMKKHPQHDSAWLDEEDLPQWRVIQQMGRVRRFSPGMFTLFGTPFAQRKLETEPEVARLPLVSLVMACAEYGIRAHELTFDCLVSDVEVEKAELRLQRLGIISSACELTPKGQFVKRLPVDPEVGAMLFQAKKLGILYTFVGVAALMGEGDIKANHRDGFAVAMDENTRSSDWLAAAMAFARAEKRLFWLKDKNWGALQNELGWEAWNELELIRNGDHPRGLRDPKRFLLEHLNVSTKKFWAVKDNLRDLEDALSRDLSTERRQEVTAAKVRQCILAGEVTQLMAKGYYTNEAKKLETGANYSFGMSSVVQLGGEAILCSGFLRTITTKRGGQLTILTEVTAYTLEDMMATFADRPDILTFEERREKVGYYAYQTVKLWKLFGAYDLMVEKQTSPLTTDEEAQKAAFEAERERLSTVLKTLNPLREELGLSAVQLGRDEFRLGYYGSAYVYTAEDVARAKVDNTNAINARRAELEAARLKAERFAAIRPQFEALSQLRKEAGLSELTFERERFHDQRSYFDYSAESLAKLTAELEAHKANQQAEAERVQREETERREAEANRQQALTDGKTRIEKLNRRREVLGWDVLSDCGEDFWFGGRYVAYTDDEGIQQAEREVVAEERKRADEAARAANTMTNRDALAAMLGSKFAVSRR